MTDTADDAIRIASGQGFWGDDLEAPVRQVERGPIDYLMMDYLAEVTGLRAADEAHPPGVRRAGYPRRHQRRRSEPPRVRRGTGRGRSGGGGGWEGPRGHGHGRRPHGSSGRPPGGGSRPRAHGDGRVSLHGPRPRPERQRLHRRGPDRGSPPAGRPGGGHGAVHRHGAHLRSHDARFRVEPRRLRPAGGRGGGGPHQRVRGPVFGRELLDRLVGHPGHGRRGLPHHRGPAVRRVRRHQARWDGRPGVPGHRHRADRLRRSTWRRRAPTAYGFTG